MTINMQRLLIAWTVISVAVLLGSLYNQHTKETAASVAFMMTMISFPSSIIAGEILNYNNVGLTQISSSALFVFIVWLHFFLFGALQWSIVLIILGAVKQSRST